MTCMNCGTLSFSPNFPPFGGFFCANDHAQCSECNRKHNEHCSICLAPTQFVKMVTTKAPMENGEQTTDDEAPFVVSNETIAPLAIDVEPVGEEAEATVILYQRSKRCRQIRGDDKQSTFARVDERFDESRSYKGQCRWRRTDSQIEDIRFLETSKSFEDLDLLDKMTSGVIFATGKHARTRSQPPSRTNKRGLTKAPACSELRRCLQQKIEVVEPMEPHRCVECLLKMHRVDDDHRANKHLDGHYDTSVESHGTPMRIQAGQQLHSIVNNGSAGVQLNDQAKDHMQRIEELDRMRKTLELQAQMEKLELLRVQGMTEDQQMHLEHRPQQCDYVAEQLEFTHMSPVPMPVAKDSTKETIDVRMENIFKTLKEEPKPTMMPSKKLLRSRRDKVRFEGVSDDEDQKQRNRQQRKRKQMQDIDKHNVSMSAQDKQKEVEEYLTRIRRACCVPFTMSMTSTSSCVSGTKYCVEPPAAQSMPIQATKYEISDVLGRIKQKIEAEHCNPICISRLPVYCPDADCRRIAFISDLNTHFIHDHTALTMERISSGQAKTFFLDPQVTRDSAAKCHMLYLVKDKNIQLGDSEFGNLLPVLVMSCRIHLLDVCDYRDTNIAALKKSNPNDEILMLWLTGLVPDEGSLTATLAVWPLAADYAENHTVRTCNIYSIRESQNIRDIYNSNSAMHLTWPMVQQMSNNGVNMIGVQVVVN